MTIDCYSWQIEVEKDRYYIDLEDQMFVADPLITYRLTFIAHEIPPEMLSLKKGTVLKVTVEAIK